MMNKEDTIALINGVNRIANAMEKANKLKEMELERKSTDEKVTLMAAK